MGLKLLLLLATLMTSTSKRATKRPADPPIRGTPQKASKKNTDKGEGSKKGKKKPKKLFDLPNEKRPQQTDRTRFENRAAEDTYWEMRKTRGTYIPERGINRAQLADDRVMPVLDFFQWGNMAMHPEGNASMKLALEVYANLLETENPANVLVRGVRMDFSASAINAHYGIPDEGSALVEHLNPTPWERLAGSEGVKLNRDDELEMHMTHVVMPWRTLAHVWHGRVKPTAHEHFLNHHVFEYIFSLAQGRRFNVGEYIATRMREVVKNKGAAMTYLHLIRDMCGAAGIVPDPDELQYEPLGAFQVQGYAARRSDRLFRVAQPVVFRPDPPPGEFILTVPPNIDARPRRIRQLPPVPAADDVTRNTFDMLQTMQAEQRLHQAYTRDALQRIGRVLHGHFPDHPDLPLPDFDPPPPEE